MTMHCMVAKHAAFTHFLPMPKTDRSGTTNLALHVDGISHHSEYHLVMHSVTIPKVTLLPVLHCNAVDSCKHKMYMVPCSKTNCQKYRKPIKYYCFSTAAGAGVGAGHPGSRGGFQRRGVHQLAQHAQRTEQQFLHSVPLRQLGGAA